MWLNKKYLLLIIVIGLCILHCYDCKSNRKKSNTGKRGQKLKRMTATAKLVKNQKSFQSSRNKEIQKAMETLKIHKVIEPNAKLIGKKGKQQLKLSSDKKSNKVTRSLKDIMKSSKLSNSATKPAIIFANGVTRKQRDRAVDIVSELVRKANKSSDLVDRIRKEFEKEFGFQSNVILSAKPLMEQSIIKIPGTVVLQLSLVNDKDKDQVMVSVFGLTKQNNLEERNNALMKRAQKLSPKVIDSLMSNDMRQEITKMAIRVVRNADSISEVTDQTTELLNDKFGPHWHTVVGHKSMFSVDDHRKTSVFFLNMDFGDMRVSIFK